MSKRQSRTHTYWLAVGVWATAAAIVVLALTLGYSARMAGTSAQIVAEVSTPNLVAVQIHADWCNRSPAVAPIFAELLTQYGNEPVLFVSLDITDDIKLGQARLLVKSLGISPVFDAPFESGMIKLIDRENEAVLASITGREQSAEFEVRLAEFLDAAQRDESGSGT